MTFRAQAFMLMMGAVALLIFQGCRNDSTTDAPQAPAVNAIREWQGGRSRVVIQGEEVYKHNCAICHGDAADGTGFNASLLAIPPPNLLPLANEAHRAQVLTVIEKGSAAVGKSSLCPPHGGSLTSVQREAIFEFLVHLADQPAPVHE